MLILPLIFLTFLTFFALNIACLPLLAEKNRSLAIKLKSSIYDKGIKHLIVLAGIFSLLFGISLLADYYLNGLIVNHFIKPNFFDLFFIVVGSLYIFNGIIFICYPKNNKKIKNIFLKFSFLIGLIQWALLSLLSFAYLTKLHFITGAFNLNGLLLWIQNFQQVPFYFYAFICLFMGILGAHFLSMFFLLFRRNKDDFGRDYYNTLLKSHAKRSVVSGILMLIPMLILCILYPFNLENFSFLVNDLSKFALILPMTLQNSVIALSKYYVLLPFTFVFFALTFMQALALAAIPMQRKSFIFLAFIFFILGIFFFFYHILNFNSALFLLNI